eukprot:GDKJ01042450.1.p1 GENE.GDKJ01042450.1~~GDKJ01042450.1.p1  ORF type:complete len:586 (-),score=140.36 GDKJ01042450.1:67-1632(-)
MTQNELKKNVDVGTGEKIVKLPLNFGEYRVDTSRNGRYVVMGGHKGHLASYDTHSKKYASLVNVTESIRAVKYLHNHTMFAAAQRKYTYIYDQQGTELHCLRDASHCTHLDFLPYHFLLVTACERAHIRWLDVSSGQVAADHNTRLGPPTALAQSANNAVMHVGHNNGQVTLWTPNMPTPVAKMFAHRGAVSSIAINSKHQMITVGGDGQWKAWDMRNFKKLNEFTYTGLMPSPIDISLSATNTLALVGGPVVMMYTDPFSTSMDSKQARSYVYKPYMKHHEPGAQFYSARFAPFEDLLWVGSDSGIRSILVPGAGMANFDGMQNNPFETKKQRQEAEVKGLLEKLPYDTIVYNPQNIGGVDAAPRAVKVKEAQEARISTEEQKAAEKAQKNKMRGKNKAGKRERKKAEAYSALVKSRAMDRVELERAEFEDEEAISLDSKKRSKTISNVAVMEEEEEFVDAADLIERKRAKKIVDEGETEKRVMVNKLKQISEGFDPLDRFKGKDSGFDLNSGKKRRRNA